MLFEGRKKWNSVVASRSASIGRTKKKHTSRKVTDVQVKGITNTYC